MSKCNATASLFILTNIGSLFLGLLYNIIDTFSVRNNVEIIFGQLNKYADFPPLKYNNNIIL